MEGWAQPDIAEKQRELVDRQLEAMREGNPPAHFTVAAGMLAMVKATSGLESVTLLDAGCASAYYWEIIDHFLPGWVQYTGIDCNSGMVEMARRRYPHLPVVQADLCDLRMFDDLAFDIVLAGAAIDTVWEWRRVLAELARLAKRYLLLHRNFVYPNWKPTTFQLADAYGHTVWYIQFNEKKLIGEVASLGFDLVFSCPSGEGVREGQVRSHLFERRNA
jgi:SAM-dependent methyltransferase